MLVCIIIIIIVIQTDMQGCQIMNFSWTFSEKRSWKVHDKLIKAKKRLISACRVKVEGMAQVYAARIKSEEWLRYCMF